MPIIMPTLTPEPFEAEGEHAWVVSGQSDLREGARLERMERLLQTPTPESCQRQDPKSEDRSVGTREKREWSGRSA